MSTSLKRVEASENLHKLFKDAGADFSDIQKLLQKSFREQFKTHIRPLLRLEDKEAMKASFNKVYEKLDFENMKIKKIRKRNSL